MGLFSGLNEHQKQAVETVAGRLLILAGAGSGKTRVLTLRMAHLIQNCGVHPKSILGLTFTNKAAEEMRHRLATFIDQKASKQVTLATFHSFCMQILRSEIQHLGYTNDFTLYDETDVQRLMQTIARDLLEHEGEMPSLAPTTERISFARSKGLKAEELPPTGAEWHDGFTQSLYQRLQDSMRAYNAVDFDSLLNLTVELFENHPSILEKYQERYRYIMIDEYQDTNPIQYRLASLLSAKYNHLCVVGDDDQSIYGWRGADVQNILDFTDSKVIKLEQNYRSTNVILKAANALIAHNKKRHGKALWSSKGEGELIEVFHAPTEVEEAQAVVYRMDRLRIEKGLEWKDVAILYRSNSLSRCFETELLKFSWHDGDKWVKGIPYHIHGGTEFYGRKEIKDLVGYLRVLVNRKDEEALLRVINFPRRGIGEAALDAITKRNRSNKIPLWEVLLGLVHEQDNYIDLKECISAKAMQGIRSFVDLIESAQNKFSNQSLHESLEWLIGKIDYQKAIAEEVKSDQMRQFKWENVQELVSSLAEYEEKPEEEGSKSLRDFIQNLPLDSDWTQSNKKIYGDNRVTLMTFHSAKGLEFPVCFLVGIEDHIIPHEKSMKQTGIEEERRLMYVAVTRAKQYLTISMARRRKRMGVDTPSQPSRFLLEIPKDLLRISSWDG